MNQAPEVRLTGRAERFLQLLQDFGHLDDEGVARVMLGVGGDGWGPGQLADIDEVRRAAAQLLVEQSGGELTGLLADDWPLLFS